MDLVTLMRDQRDSILAEIETALSQRRLRHYQTAGRETLHRRLERLFEVTALALEAKNLLPIIHYAEEVARQRFEAGYDISEVQTVFNGLEEVVWKRILDQMDPADYALALGSLGTVLGAAKDELARAYVEAATRAQTPRLDLTSLFRR